MRPMSGFLQPGAMGKGKDGSVRGDERRAGGGGTTDFSHPRRCCTLTRKKLNAELEEGTAAFTPYNCQRGAGHTGLRLKEELPGRGGYPLM
jgi:hypothetical protein